MGIVRRTTGNVLISKYATFYPYGHISCGIAFDNAEKVRKTPKN
jgi:hypothetical protein